MQPGQGAGVITTFIVVAAAIAWFGPARGHSGSTWIQTTPGTSTPGEQVSLRANCPSNTSPARVTSPALGTVTLQPRNGLLTANAPVRPNTRSGTYQVVLTCSDGTTAKATVRVLGLARPTTGPNTGGGFLARNHLDAATPDGGRAASGASGGASRGGARRG